jgi:hypothetical protein
MIVALATAPPGKVNPTVLTCEVLYDGAGIGILEHGPGRNWNLNVIAITSIAPVTGAVTAVFSAIGAHHLQMAKGPEVVPHYKDNIAATSAIASIRTALGYIFFPAKGNTTVASVSGGNINISLI